MFLGDVSTWNLRDRHMAETLDALLAHLDRQVGRAKIVVWAHNSHLGDARATEMSRRGELNLGQLARERHGGRLERDDPDLRRAAGGRCLGGLAAARRCEQGERDGEQGGEASGHADRSVRGR